MTPLDDLLDQIDQLRGVCPELDQIADGLEGLTTRTYTRDLRQTTITRLAGADDDTIHVLASLVLHLCTTGADLNELPDDVRKDTERYGQDAALYLSALDLHQPASEAAALIDPMNTPTVGGRCQAVIDEPNKKLSKELKEVNKRSSNRPK